MATQNITNITANSTPLQELRTSTWILEAISSISAITGVSMYTIDDNKTTWDKHEYVSIDFSTPRGSILFDLDLSTEEDYLLGRVMDELIDTEIRFNLKLYGIEYSERDVENIFHENDIEDFNGLIEHLEDRPRKIWYKEYRDKMDYKEFKKEYPEEFI